MSVWVVVVTLQYFLGCCGTPGCHKGIAGDIPGCHKGIAGGTPGGHKGSADGTPGCHNLKVQPQPNLKVQPSCGEPSSNICPLPGPHKLQIEYTQLSTNWHLLLET